MLLLEKLSTALSSCDLVDSAPAGDGVSNGCDSVFLLVLLGVQPVPASSFTSDEPLGSLSELGILLIIL